MAITLAPDFSEAYRLRGNSKFALQDYRGAIQDFDQTIEQTQETIDSNKNSGFSERNEFVKVFLRQAYFYRGLAKLNINQKSSGCMDLSKAGEIGDEDAYDAIQKYCAN